MITINVIKSTGKCL